MIQARQRKAANNLIKETSRERLELMKILRKFLCFIEEIKFKTGNRPSTVDQDSIKKVFDNIFLCQIKQKIQQKKETVINFEEFKSFIKYQTLSIKSKINSLINYIIINILNQVEKPAIILQIRQELETILSEIKQMPSEILSGINILSIEQLSELK